MSHHVAVLKGGLSSEREVSLNTGKAVAQALKSKGYKVTEVDVDNNISAALTEIKPDVVFNALHGTYGEDGCIQGVLEFLRIPYTHSGVMASAVAMHKPTAKVLFESVGIKCAEGKVVTRQEAASGRVMEAPYVIKPIDEGSSVGVLIVLDGDEVNENDEGFPQGDNLLIEKYISGRELSVAVMEGKALGVVEIKPKDGFYDYRNKYTSGMTEYLIPAPVDEKIYKQALEMAEKADKILGCRGVSRADIRYGDDGKLYMLEVNTHPGMTSTSLVPKIAAKSGMDFENLVDRLVRIARCDIEA